MVDIIDFAQVKEAAEALRAASPLKPRVAYILGSGLGPLAEHVENRAEVPFCEIPHMQAPRFSGHNGVFHIGTLEEVPVICMRGRLHLYEGFSAQEVAFPIFVLNELGVDTLVITNAAGGIDVSFNVGDLMLITDHINFLGCNPCTGMKPGEGIQPFSDMTHAYSVELLQAARAAARDCGVTLKEGVYIANPGPSLETPAEIRAYRTWGADAVGMSTISEVIAANACGMRVLGISLISNPAAGIKDIKLTAEDMYEAAHIAGADLQKLLLTLIPRL